MNKKFSRRFIEREKQKRKTKSKSITLSSMKKPKQKPIKKNTTNLPEDGKRKIIEETQKNFEIEKTKKSQAKMFSLLLDASPTSDSWIPKITQILLSFFQISFIFSTHLSRLYFTKLPQNIQYQYSILHPESTLNSISSYFNILTFTRKMSIEMLYTTIIFFIFFHILIYTILKKISFFNFFFKINIRKLKVNIWIKLIAILLTNFDISFFIGNVIAVNSLSCKEVSYSVITGFSNGGNFLDSSSYSSEYLQQVESRLKTTMLQKQVSFLNDDVGCRSYHHFGLIIFSLILTVVNFLIKIYSLKMMTLVPRCDLFCTKMNNSDLFVDAMLMVILVLKTVFITFFVDSYDLYGYMHWIFLSMLLICYFLLSRKFIFYNKKFSRTKNFQILFLMSITSLGIFARETKFGGSLHESSMFILLLLVMSLLTKLDLNFRKIFNESEGESFGKGVLRLGKAEIKEEKVMHMYYRITSYISYWVERKDSMAKSLPKEIETTHFVIGVLLKDHKNKCKKTSCFCNGSKHFLKICTLSFLKKSVKSGELPLVYESLHLMMEIFNKFFIMSKRRGNKRSNQVFNCYFYFLMNYFGNPKKAFTILQQRIHEKKLHGNNEAVRDFEIYVMLEQFHEIGEKNMTRAVLGLAKHADDFNLMNIKKKEATINFGIYLDYLEELEEFKLKIKEVYLSKLEFLKILSKRKNINVRDIVEVSKKFFEGKLVVDSKYRVLEKVTRMKFSPLYLIYGVFLKEISEEYGKALKIMKKYRKIVNYKDFNFVFDDNQKRKFSRMMIVIAEIGDKKGTQLFKYSTSNCSELLGWKNEEILDQQLELVLPEPVRTVHYLLFTELKEKPVNFRLVTKNERRVPAIAKNGFLIPTDATVRISNSISNTFKVVTSLIFKKSFKNNCILLTDASGKIREMSETASKYFDKEEFIATYNAEFQEIDDSINTVFTEMIHMKNFTQDYFKEMSKDKKRIGAWLTFIRAKEVNTYKIIDKEGRVLNVEGRFEGYIVHKLKAFMKYFVIKKIEDEVFDFDRMMPKFNSNELDIMKNLICYVKDKYDIQDFEGWSQEFDFENGMMEESGRVLTSQYRSQRKREKNIFDEFDPISEENSGEEEESEVLVNQVRVFETERNKFRQDNFDKEEVLIHQKNQKEAVSLMEFEMEKPDFENREKKNFSFGTEEKLKKDKSKKKNFVRKKSQSMKSQFLKIQKNSKIFDVLDRKIKESKSKERYLRVFRIVFPIILFLNIFFLSTISNHQKETYKIIENHAMSVDIYCWVFWAQMYSVMSLDVIRAAKEGWIDSSTSGLFISETYSAKWHNKLKRTGQFFLSPDNKIDTVVRNMADTTAVYYKKWINSEIMITTSLSQTEHEPIQIKLPRRASVQFLQGFSNLVYYRDYENDTNIKNLKSNEDRSADPNEEVYRVNLVGDMNKAYFDLSHEFFEYIVNIAQEFHDHLGKEALLLAGVNFGFVIFLIVIFLIEVEKMKKFYKKIFNFKVNKIETIMDYFESKEKNLTNILLEEKKINQNNKKKLVETRILKGKKSTITQKNYKKFEEKLKINFKKYSFGLMKVAFSTLTILIIIQIVYLSLQYYQRPKARLVKNLLKVYTLGSDIWNTLAMTHTFFLQAVIFNNTVPCWNGKKSLDCYKESRDYMNRLLVNDISESAEYDLGNFTNEFSDVLTKRNSCETVFSDEIFYRNQCYKFYDGLFTSNLLNTMRGMMTTLELMVDEWEQKRHDFEEVKKMMTNTRFHFIYSMFDEINASIYYFFTINPSNMLIKEVKSPSSILENLIRGSVVFVFFLWVVAFCLMDWKLRETSIGFYSVLYVLPKKLIQSNMVMIHHLRKVKNGNALY